MRNGEWITALITLSFAAPAAAALVTGALMAWGRTPSEKAVTRLTQSALMLSMVGVVSAAVLFIQRGMTPFSVDYFTWYEAGDHGFHILARIDFTNLTFAMLAAVLLLATARFSSLYLHYEPGFIRFHALMLVFAAGMQLIAIGGNYEMLFAGWEMAGLTSVLLVGFFHERNEPPRSAMRVLITYRICDVGLLFAMGMMHLFAHSTVFEEVFSKADGAAWSLAAAVGLVFASLGKGALFPMGGWLPRAMEGPTASSAIFYGGLSVHAAVFLLIRSAPLFAGHWTVHALIAGAGLITVVSAALAGQTRPDAKSSLAWATIAQVGVMFVEVGLGLNSLAMAHLCAHALLRYYQFLRAPSALQDALARRTRTSLEGQAQESPSSSRLRLFVYRLALEGFGVESALDRWIVRPFISAARAMDRFERRWIVRVGEAGSHWLEPPHEQLPQQKSGGARVHTASNQGSGE
ncbi:MAG: NAD(P)H-quinone oxidoreductase subunit 2, chloroplastic [Myxococcota bacterium]|nr:NAD(P)H-quinone oxidoreductase subunit 2, chloroplastic [Myxococcota bacterium]